MSNKWKDWEYKINFRDRSGLKVLSKKTKNKIGINKISREHFFKIFDNLDGKLLVLVLGDEGMAQHFPNFHSFFRLLFHYAQNKVFGFFWCVDVLRELYFVLYLGLNDMYYTVQVQLRINPKRNLAQKTLVGHHTNVPNVNFLIVLHSHYNLRRVIKRTAYWGSLPHPMAFVHRPAEVANLRHSLN